MDLAHFVNGRAAAALTMQERSSRCAAQRPGFALLNAGQTIWYMRYQDLTGWRVCGEYDFATLRQPDRHFLLVRPEAVAAACGATSYTSAPLSLALVEPRYP